jgi:hypothetical protein
MLAGGRQAVSPLDLPAEATVEALREGGLRVGEFGI